MHMGSGERRTVGAGRGRSRAFKLSESGALLILVVIASCSGSAAPVEQHCFDTDTGERSSYRPAAELRLARSSSSTSAHALHAQVITTLLHDALGFGVSLVPISGDISCKSTLFNISTGHIDVNVGVLVLSACFEFTGARDQNHGVSASQQCCPATVDSVFPLPGPAYQEQGGLYVPMASVVWPTIVNSNFDFWRAYQSGCAHNYSM